MAIVVAVAAAGCSSGGADDVGADAAPVSSEPLPTSTIDPFTPSPTTTSEMRPVPTVPSSNAEGQVAADAGAADDDVDGDGVIPAPTLVAPAASSPPVSVAPPSTDLVGDPQPTPGTTTPLPPPTVEPPPAACDRLAEVAVGSQIEAFMQSVDTVSPVLGDQGCRYTAGSSVVEVWFIPLSELRDDWYLRPGIEPVAEAGGDAVGLPGFRGSDGSTGDGYTVATAGDADGVIVSVAGAVGDPLSAGFIAAIAAQA